jgi:hypothetical protein
LTPVVQKGKFSLFSPFRQRKEMDAVVLIVIAMGCIAIGIAETVCAAAWAPFCFRRGLVIYRRTYEIPPDFRIEIDAPGMERGFRGSLFPSFVFKRMGEGEYAFRETILQPCLLRYVPIMKGHMRIEPQSRVMTVEGRLGWFSTVFPLCCVGTVLSESESPSFSVAAIAVLALSLTLLYFIQGRRFNKVGASLTGGRVPVAKRD